MNYFGKRQDLIIRKDDPFNAGPPLGLLRQSLITPTDLFFVRNHGTVPSIDSESYRLVINGLVEKPLSLPLEEIRQYPKATVMATLQCAGNRRQEFIAFRSINGEVPWGPEAISTALWSGVRLRHLLLRAGPDPKALHIAFRGLDKVLNNGSTISFGGSIPRAKAMSPEVILAYEMNGKPLPPVHGAPLRLVVPGYIGARSVKWLGEISLQAGPSDNYFQARTYRLFPPDVRSESADPQKGISLSEQPVNAVICQPGDGETVFDDVILVEGYATASGDHLIEKVELSIDDGRQWIPARIPDVRRSGAWCFWEAQLRLRPGTHRITVRAWDSANRTQPDKTGDVWNIKGYMNNSWHRIKIKVAEDD